MGGYGMTMGFGMGFGLLLMLLFFVAVIWLIITLASGKGIREEESDTLAILKKRYARGEISKEEYEEMKRELS
jgi:putative membrane protein